MTCVIQVHAIAGTVVQHGGFDPAGTWVENYDPEAFDGQGDVTLTADVRTAKRFASAGEAMQFYQRQSRRRPRRADGGSNRPLTAFTISIVPLP